MAFSILIGVEFLLLTILVLWADVFKNRIRLDVDDLCLRVQAIIIIPSEFMYAASAGSYLAGTFTSEEFKECDKECIGFFLGCLPCCCCYTPAALLSSLCTLRQETPYEHPGVRIGISLMEWLFLITWAIANPDRSKFLFSFDYGLAVFIVSVICFIIHTQYMYFFPNFALPDDIYVRSLYGYAFNGELEELKRLKIPAGSGRLSIEWDDDDPSKSKLPDLPRIDSKDCAHWTAFYGKLEQFKEFKQVYFRYNAAEDTSIWLTPTMLAISNRQDHIVKYIEESGKSVDDQGKFYEGVNVEIARAYLKSDYWDMSSANNKILTPAMLALSMGHYHVVEYLERERGAKLHRLIFDQQQKHKSMNKEFAREFIGRYYFSTED